MRGDSGNRRLRPAGVPKEVKPLTFRCYLKEQRDRDDPVGALARRILADRGDLPANRLEAYRSLLETRGCSGREVRALEAAWFDYRRESKLRDELVMYMTDAVTCWGQGPSACWRDSNVMSAENFRMLLTCVTSWGITVENH